MKILHIDEKDYRIPNGLNDFQLHMYLHLIKWKWEHITVQPGYYKDLPYDAILPDAYVQQGIMPHIYEPVRKHLNTHRNVNPFRIHPHFYHVVSSQAANINLFLPALNSPHVNAIMGSIKDDFRSLAVDHLHNGYCLEYWGGNFNKSCVETGLLGDKSKSAGTDADIAIAYRNHQNELCLWLIEHKLTEEEFTSCGGYKSKGRTDKQKHDCSLKFRQILENKSACYYHDKCGYKYWDITEQNKDVFLNHSERVECPFQGGMNQLWRNLLLALALEQDNSNEFVHVTFSVVKHPLNTYYLDKSISDFQKLTGHNPRFSVFTSEELIKSAEKIQDSQTSAWAKWYREMYML